MPRRILIVDDELAALRRVHVEGAVADFYDAVADSTDPRFENLQALATTVPAAHPFVESEEAALAYFASDEAVRDLLLSAHVRNGAIPQLRALLEPVWDRAARVEKLRQHFASAFPAPDFEIAFRPDRPPLDQVSACAALFLDLFLEDGSPGAVDAVHQYLSGISDQAHDTILPPIVLMSSHSEILEHRRNFSGSSRISGAGLMILPKAKIAEPHFGAPGLRLSFDQLSRQSLVAHSMRRFMASWTRAMQSATANTAKALWNLDASAMQQIHLASVRDADPYDEHLSELLGRDHLFRVESDVEVAARIQQLDASFRGYLAEDPREIGNRLIAPLTDVANARAFMSHFTWLGALPSEQLVTFHDSEIAERISRSLPFGSVLCGSTIGSGARCLVHITQQCDLNGISRTKDVAGTLIFAVADAQELFASDNPNSPANRIVLRSLQMRENGIDREFDLTVSPGEVLAMPLREFVSRVRNQRLRVVGRLRSDIANQIVTSTTSHLSRPAAQAMLRPGMVRAKAFLQSMKLRNGRSALMGDQGKARVLLLTKDKDLFSFQDDACVDVALWLASELATLGVQIQVDPLCTALRKGWRDEKNLPGDLMARVREHADLNDAWRGLAKEDVAEEGRIQFTVVVEK
jgi:hypothetical protein